MTVKHLTFPKPASHPRLPNHTVSKARAAKRRKREALKDAVYVQVDKRDRYICRATGVYIGRGRGARHHIVFRSLGGKHETGNVVTLCDTFHALIHGHKATCVGNADQTLTFSDKHGRWESPRP